MPDIQLSELVQVNPLRPKIDLNPTDEVSFIPMSDVLESGRWVNHQSRQFGDVSRGYTYFEEGDVLFAKITPCMENGKGCYPKNLANGIGFASTEFHVIRAKDNADAGFISQWSVYKPLRLKASATMIGSAGQQRVPASFLESFKVPLIAKPEQIKIAEILSTVNQAIEQTEALIAKQQRIKTGLMQDLLTRGIDENGNLRSEETHEFKDSPLGRIPVEWNVRNIDSISDFITSGARGWAKYYSDEGAVFLRIGNLTRAHINMRFDDIVSVRPPERSEGLRTLVVPGDVLISITADLGMIGVIPEGFGEGYVNQHIALVRITDPEIDKRFIGWFLQSRVGQSQFERHNESGAKAGLNLPTIRSLLVVNPPLVEQGHIAEVLDTNAKVISRLQTEQDKQRHLKTALMQDLLTGKVPVTPLLTEEERSA